ncbi:Transmembrane protein [Trema orientale]|uniref:Transmembrane protein n=1 Tax=Trema orientale TaxID=63057 RepID=A0A2P5EGP5_TREOI|nr:Transmembrane protein [Trema orientale]
MKNYSKTSMKSLCFVLGLILIIVTAQFNEADCRALRSTENTASTGAGGCEQNEGREMAVGMASFAVSSNSSSSNSNTSTSSSSRPLARSLSFRLASGPSKKGPGH